MKKFLPKNCEFYKFFRCFSVNVRLEPLSFLLCLSNSILFVRSVYQANHKNQHPYDKKYEKAFTPMLMRTFQKWEWPPMLLIRLFLWVSLTWTIICDLQSNEAIKRWAQKLNTEIKCFSSCNFGESTETFITQRNFQSAVKSHKHRKKLHEGDLWNYSVKRHKIKKPKRKFADICFDIFGSSSGIYVLKA